MTLAASPVLWHHDLAWAMLALGFACALAILADELLLGNRQHMPVMNLVHPITALYWGPVWLWLYFTRGRKASRSWAGREAQRLLAECRDPRAKAEELRGLADSTASRDLRPWHVANAVSHCGAGCTLGDICGEWLVLTLGLAWFGTWSGHQLPEELLLDFVCAWTLGIAFQYLTVVPMGSAGKLEGIWRAIKVDTASILAFQLGLFGWMAIVMLVIWPQHGIRIDSPDFWFEMQVGMILGSLTAWPVNRWLVSHGIKEKMDHRRHLAMELGRLAEHGEVPRAAA
ncbi:MAG: DUF4396 domain-containing protein [Gaiellaceae bacterium]